VGGGSGSPAYSEGLRQESGSNQADGAASRGQQPGLAQQFSDFGLKGEAFLVAHVGEAEWLQIALRGTHWEQHRGLPAYRTGAEVHGQVYGHSLIEAIGKFKQASGGRNPEHLGPELAAIFQLNCRGHGSPQIDARGTDFSSGVGEVGHYEFHYATRREIAHITKAGGYARIWKMEFVQLLS